MVRILHGGNRGCGGRGGGQQLKRMGLCAGGRTAGTGSGKYEPGV